MKRLGRLYKNLNNIRLYGEKRPLTCPFDWTVPLPVPCPPDFVHRVEPLEAQRSGGIQRRRNKLCRGAETHGVARTCSSLPTLCLKRPIT